MSGVTKSEARVSAGDLTFNLSVGWIAPQDVDGLTNAILAVAGVRVVIFYESEDARLCDYCTVWIKEDYNAFLVRDGVIQAARRFLSASG